MDAQDGLLFIVAGLAVAAVWLILRLANAEYEDMTDEERDENRTW